MILQHNFKTVVVVITGAILLLVLPMRGVCQSEPVQAEQPPHMMEEVIVFGQKPLVELKLEAYQAEDVLYDLFNSLNTNDDFDVHCEREASVGSHIKTRVCRSNIQRELLRTASQRMMRGERYVYPAAELRHMSERMLDDMTRRALENPEMLEALVRATEAKDALESERKRRCEGRIVCW